MEKKEIIHLLQDNYKNAIKDPQKGIVVEIMPGGFLCYKYSKKHKCVIYSEVGGFSGGLTQEANLHELVERLYEIRDRALLDYFNGTIKEWKKYLSSFRKPTEKVEM